MKKMFLFLAMAMVATGLFAAGAPTEEEAVAEVSATEQFFAAVQASDDAAVQGFLNDGAVTVDTVNADGNTALMLAIINQDLQMVLTLVPYRPSTNVTNNAGKNASQLAQESGNLAIQNAVNGL